MGFHYWIFLLCVPIFISFNTAQPQVCNSTAGDFTVNGSYGRNRELALLSLAFNTSENGGFYYTTVGEDPNKVYAQALCRGDYSEKDCSSCINSTIQDLVTNCPNQKEAISMGNCMIRYANRLFFEILELKPNVEGYNTGDLLVNLNQFGQIWESLLDSLVRNASTGTSRLKFATGEAQLTNSQTIHALMQCTPDLSQIDCNTCLRRSMSDYQICCYGQQVGYVQKPSCFLQLDLYPFYMPPPSAPGSPPLDSNSTNTTTAYGKYIFTWTNGCIL
ncbi:hypothetical protein SLA2020_220660 [Shorea laevis]